MAISMSHGGIPFGCENKRPVVGFATDDPEAEIEIEEMASLCMAPEGIWVQEQKGGFFFLPWHRVHHVEFRDS